MSGQKSGSMDWSAVQDGVVITRKMTDDQVWNRCQLFGGSRLADALENWLRETDGEAPEDKVKQD